MSKEKTINIRIQKKEYDNIKKYECTFAKIWEMGYHTWINNIPELLEKRIEELKIKYVQCTDSLEKSKDNVHTTNSELDALCKEYINFGKSGEPGDYPRSVDNPTTQDKMWINSRTKKLDGISEKVFLEHCKKLKQIDEYDREHVEKTK